MSTIEKQTYSYEVWRKDEDAFYRVRRNGVQVTQRKIDFFDMGFLNGLKACFRVDSERAIKLQLQYATKQAQYAVKVLEESEIITNQFTRS